MHSEALTLLPPAPTDQVRDGGVRADHPADAGASGRLELLASHQGVQQRQRDFAATARLAGEHGARHPSPHQGDAHPLGWTPVQAR